MFLFLSLRFISVVLYGYYMVIRVILLLYGGNETNYKCHISIYEPRHEKTNILHMRKQRRRSASR